MELLIPLLDLSIFNPQARVLQLAFDIARLMYTDIYCNTGLFRGLENSQNKRAVLNRLDQRYRVLC